MTTEVVMGVGVVGVGVVDVAGVVIGRTPIVGMVVVGETERSLIMVHKGGVLGMVIVEGDGEAFLELKFKIHQVRKLSLVAG